MLDTLERKQNPTNLTKRHRHKASDPHETHAIAILDELIEEGVFDNFQRTHDLDQVGIDAVLMNHFPRGFRDTSVRTREFRMFVQFKPNEEDAGSFAQSNPCVIPWAVADSKTPLQAKIELLRAIIDWLVLHRNQYAIDFFRNHLNRYESSAQEAAFL